MTVLEQRFLEVVPMYLKCISDTLKVIAQSLDKKDNGKADENPGSRGDIQSSR